LNGLRRTQKTSEKKHASCSGKTKEKPLGETCRAGTAALGYG